MRNIKWYTWIGIGILFFVLTLAFGKIFSKIDEVAHSEAIAVKVESKKIDQSLQMEIETKDSGSLTSMKQIPKTRIESIDVPIRQWTDEMEQTFFNEMEQTEFMLDEDAAAHFSLQTNAEMLTDDLYTIIMQYEQSIDKQNEYQNEKSFVLHLEDEKILSLSDITNDRLNMKKLNKLLKKNTDEKWDGKRFKSNYEKLDELNWAIHDDNITFYFPNKQIEEKDEDTETDEDKVIKQFIKISIPYTQFYPYLNNDYYEEIISENEITQQIEKTKKEKQQKEAESNNNTLNEKKLIALTFDDGPHPTETKRILKTLEEYNAKATFFTLSNNVKNYPDIANEIVNQGHEIANHSMSHANLNAIKPEKAEKEIVDSQQQIYDVTGVKPTLFRPPYGNFDQDVQSVIHDSGQSIVLWSVDTVDWDNKNANTIYHNITQDTVPGSIILMHDIHTTSADALPKILQYFNEQGYQLVTVSEILPYIKGNESGPYYGN